MSFGQVPVDRGGNLLRSYRIVSAEEADDEQPGIETVIDRDGSLHRRYGAVAPVLYVIRPDDYIGFRAAVPNDVPLAEYLRQIGLEVGDVRSEPRKS
jgi:hypothetical protein